MGWREEKGEEKKKREEMEGGREKRERERERETDRGSLCDSPPLTQRASPGHTFSSRTTRRFLIFLPPNHSTSSLSSMKKANSQK